MLLLQQPINNFSGQDANPEPALPVMPKKPTLLDFFHYRFTDIAFMRPRLLGCADDRALRVRGSRLGGQVPPGAALLCG
jgi:hypothetical protein